MPTEARLPVKWFSQLDSDTREAGRMCRSSTHAMAANFLKAGCLVKGPHSQSDDNYLELIRRYGDTTETQPHIEVLKSLGITAVHRENLTPQDIERQINKGIPVPCGILHHGNVDAPYGGGHWVLVVGYTPDFFVVHDPAGELDLVNGGYRISNNGNFKLYSRINFRKRWEVTPRGDGKYRYTPGNGWGTILSK